ncbi:hypothetical protein QTP86_000324 [Hemibagrus guttatus]|nr:hypothetical protein QTP86_000324 [Hemibagrus guttatus]
MFYHLVVTSIIFYIVVCRGSRVKTDDDNRLNKLVRKAGSVKGVELESLAEVSERRMLRNLLSILDNVSHPLQATLECYRSMLKSEDNHRTPQEILYSIQPYSTLLYSTLLYSTLLYSALLYSTLLYSTLLYSTLLCSSLFYSTLLYSALLYSTLLYSTLFHFILLSSALLYSKTPCMYPFREIR